MMFARNLFSTLTLVGSLLLVSPQQAIYAKTSTENTLPARVQPTAIDEWKIRDIAKQITVRVFSQENTASGILISKRQGNTGEYIYLVVTNNHVVANQKPDFRVETSDGKLYRASVYPEPKGSSIDNADLRLLYFSSSTIYEQAKLGDSSSIKNEDDVFVAGFGCTVHSCDKETEFIFEHGIALLLDKSLVDGYQLGFTSNTKIGTSGGVVLNKKGELIAINGRGKYPFKNGQYTYIDDTQPSSDLQKFMRHFAWSIPINTYRNWVSKVSLDKIPKIANSQINQSATALPQSFFNSSILSRELMLFFLLLLITIIIPIMMILKNNKSENNQESGSNNQQNKQIHSPNLSTNINKDNNKLLQKIIGVKKSNLEVELMDIKSMLQEIIHNNNQSQKRIVQLENSIDELKNESNPSRDSLKSENKNLQH